MSKTITATWSTAKGHGFADGQQILLFGFDQNGTWDEDGQLVTIHRTSNRVVLKDGRRQVWAGGVASKFWATPAPATAEAPAPVEAPDGVELRTSGKHGLKEGSVFLFHGDDKKAPAKRGRSSPSTSWTVCGSPAWTPRARSRCGSTSPRRSGPRWSSSP